MKHCSAKYLITLCILPICFAQTLSMERSLSRETQSVETQAPGELLRPLVEGHRWRDIQSLLMQFLSLDLPKESQAKPRFQDYLRLPESTGAQSCHVATCPTSVGYNSDESVRVTHTCTNELVLEMTGTHRAYSDWQSYAIRPHNNHSCTLPQTTELAIIDTENNLYTLHITQKEIEFPIKKIAGVIAIAYSPDGRYRARAIKDGTIEIEDLETSRIICTLAVNNGTQATNTMQFSHDSTWLLSYHTPVDLELWQTKNCAILSQIRLSNENVQPEEQYVYDTAICLSPTDNTIARAHDQCISIAPLDAKDHTQALLCRSETITHLQFSPDGSCLVAVEGGKQITIWLTKTSDQPVLFCIISLQPEPCLTKETLFSTISTLCLRKNQNLLVFDTHKQVQTFDLGHIFSMERHLKQLTFKQWFFLYTIGWLLQKNRWAWSFEDPDFSFPHRVYQSLPRSLRTAVEHRFPIPPKTVPPQKFSLTHDFFNRPSNRDCLSHILAYIPRDRIDRLVHTIIPIKTNWKKPYQESIVDHSPNKQIYATLAAKNGVTLYLNNQISPTSERRNTPLGHLPHKRVATCFSFSQDSTMIVTGSRDHKAKVWKIHQNFSDELLTQLTHKTGVMKVYFTPENHVITCTFDQAFDWNLPLWLKLRHLKEKPLHVKQWFLLHTICWLLDRKKKHWPDWENFPFPRKVFQSLSLIHEQISRQFFIPEESRP